MQNDINPRSYARARAIQMVDFEGLAFVYLDDGCHVNCIAIKKHEDIERSMYSVMLPDEPRCRSFFTVMEAMTFCGEFLMKKRK